MRTHYSGGIIWEGGNRLPGWPVCCTGDRAERIRDRGHITEWRFMVDCKACKKMLEKQDAFKKAKPQMWESYRVRGYCM